MGPLSKIFPPDSSIEDFTPNFTKSLYHPYLPRWSLVPQKKAG